MRRIKIFFGKKENLILFFLSVALAANSVFFVVQKLERLAFSGKPDYSSLIYFIYFILSIMVLGTILFFNEKFCFRKNVEKILLVCLPVQIIFLYEINGIKMLYCPVAGKMCLLTI
jgi:hypothetical protein